MSIKKLFITILFLLSFNTYSETIDNDNYYKIRHIYSWSNGSVHVWLESNGGEHKCNDKTYTTRYLMSRNTTLEFDQKFSILLSAKTSGQPVKLRYECDSLGLPYIKAVRF
ncbi:hypothetical protein C9J03_00970 [Photobacterium gaetbulicola]|nr:hypothetical protein C9J03_00970 [Photobacterium gaetbulicola]